MPCLQHSMMLLFCRLNIRLCYQPLVELAYPLVGRALKYTYSPGVEGERERKGYNDLIFLQMWRITQIKNRFWCTWPHYLKSCQQIKNRFSLKKWVKVLKMNCRCVDFIIDTMLYCYPDFAGLFMPRCTIHGYEAVSMVNYKENLWNTKE